MSESLKYYNDCMSKLTEELKQTVSLIQRSERVIQQQQEKAAELRGAMKFLESQKVVFKGNPVTSKPAPESDSNEPRKLSELDQKAFNKFSDKVESMHGNYYVLLTLPPENTAACIDVYQEQQDVSVAVKGPWGAFHKTFKDALESLAMENLTYASGGPKYLGPILNAAAIAYTTTYENPKVNLD